MNIVGKKLSLKEFEDYVGKKDFGSLPPTFIVLHHTWKPTKEEWNGATTIAGLKKYYEGLGWSAGPHLFIAEDGIWLFTDMYDVGIHAGNGNGTLKTGYSIGIEVVGNYDREVWSGKTKENTVGAVLALQKKLKIADGKIMFHRDYSTKTCPGTAITKEWVLAQLHGEKEEAVKANPYEKNLYAIYNGVEDLLGRMDGENPNDDETKDIVADLKKLKEQKPKVIEKIVEKPVEKIVEKIIEKPVEKIVYKDSEETLIKLKAKEAEVKTLQTALAKKSAFYYLWLSVKDGLTKMWNWKDDESK